jgi:hypothetical protein
MPRPKRPKIEPIETVFFEIDGEAFIGEVWENSADEGTRGAHMRRKRDKVFDAVLKYCEEGLAESSNIKKTTVTRLIQGEESLAAFGKIVKTIAKSQNISIEQTLSEEIALDVRIHYKATNSALLEIAKK